MTRKEQIEHQASEYANDSNNIIEWGDGWEDHNDFDQVFDAFKNGAKWADENPNKGKVYTKDELYKMGFAFDTNGNIADPRRDAEMWDRYVEYKQGKWLDKVCKYIKPILKTYCSDECVKELIEGLRNKMVSDL